MVLKITKRTTDSKGQKRALVKGIKGTTKLDTLAKKYSKQYHLPFFTNSDLTKGLLLIKRKQPLKKRLETWREWEKK